jgi:hypothetical protein
MEHEIEDWMRDTEHCFSADAVPFSPCLPGCEPISTACHFNAHSDFSNQLQMLNDKLSTCVTQLDRLYAKSCEDVKVMHNADVSTSTSSPIHVDISCQTETELLVSVGPESDTAKVAAMHHANITTASDCCPHAGHAVTEARSSSSTDAIIATVVPNGDNAKVAAVEKVRLAVVCEHVATSDTPSCVQEDSPRMLKRKAFMRSQRLKQGISDERYAEILLEQQAAAAAPPPPPEPEITLEALQLQMSEYRLRHLALDRKMEKKPRMKKQAPVTAPTTKVFVMPSLFD